MISAGLIITFLSLVHDKRINRYKKTGLMINLYLDTIVLVFMNRKLLSFIFVSMVCSFYTFGYAQINLLATTTPDDWIQRGGSAKYEFLDDRITGTSKQENQNSFLCTLNNYSDFVLEVDVMVDTAMNSGIQIRSESKPDYHNGRVHGYQIEIDPSARAWSGGIYDEARRGWLVDLSENKEGQKAFKNEEWNHYKIVAIGDLIEVWVNGVKTASLKDDMTSSGFIAFQVHGTKNSRPMQVTWKNITLKVL